MFEVIKDKIWNRLKKKEVSLAMIYDKDGEILWHKGREIEGKNVLTGVGFCKSYIEQSLENLERIDVEDYIKSDSKELSGSAEILMLKSIIIHPIHRGFFLYIDSGTREFFNEKDRNSFKLLGEILEQVITHIRGDTDASGLVGSSEAVEMIRERLLKYSLEEEPVLLSGETGVGKNHIAALIHRFSGRKGKFVIVDTPNISGSLFESILFGHKKGAFTDAKFDKTGLVEEAADGTLFFDEVTEVPLEFQAKLLRFLDTKRFYTLGESIEKEANVRIIAATNKNLQQAVEDNEFRKDLFYRLNVLEIPIPSLHERKEDIRNLVMENKILLRGKEIGEGFWDVVNNYPWPGNVRELLTVLKRAGIMLDGPITGEKMSSIINLDGSEGLPLPRAKKDDGDGLLAEIREKLSAGETFWQLLWRPFIDRDFDRNTVKGVLKSFYIESSHSFKRMTEALNVDEGDYKKFMSLLYKYRIDPRK
jgi:transcriptional regulator with PAS, ATPase and Fis domain